jgi:hypothetical protein
MLRRVQHQSSNPYLVERREYYDGQNSVIEERAVEERVRVERPDSRASSQSVRIVEIPPRRPRRQVFEEDDWYANRQQGARRSRSRMSAYDDADDYPVRRPIRAPSPPSIAGTSSLGYLEPRPYHQADNTRFGNREEAEKRGRPLLGSRRRSRSRSVVEPESSFLRPGDHITVLERHGDAGDYDTYDRDGMRVRVREI